MTRERWERLAPLVDAVLDVPASRRPAKILEVSDGDLELAAELTRFAEAFGGTEGGTRGGSLLGVAQPGGSALFDAASDFPARLQASLGPSYVIEGEIGGGAMSRVFVAEEPGLGRRVVIKVLPTDVVEGVSAERFAREIKLAASLQQANIVPVLAAGTAAGLPYYVMPFVEGRSLRDRLDRDGALPINESISILRDVARALVFAHDRGVIHRDIKPGNILLSDRTAVVTDFGIAKALGVARAGPGPVSGDLGATQTGVGIGTPAYMAPEQAIGDPGVDHRADIYAFGCLAYELLTGRPPFVGDAPHHVIAAHLQKRARPVEELRSDVPGAVSRLVAACLEKDPSHRPQGSAEVLHALEGAPVQPLGRPRRHAALLMALSGIGLAALAGLAYALSRNAEPLTFAVVPFQNASHDTSLAYRSEGMSDDILTGLAKFSGIQIVGRRAAFQIAGGADAASADLRPIHRALGARLLLTATLRESGGRVIISAQVNDSASRGEIWSESFTRGESDLWSVTDEIVGSITETLRARFGARVALRHPAAPAAGTTNSAALDLYSIGRVLLGRRGASVRRSVETFQRAIDLDPDFARAHAALAMALELGAFFDGTPPAAFIERALGEARLALALDSTLADAHVALGIAHGLTGQWEQSDADMRRAIALDPDDARARLTFARQLIVRGVADEALDELQRARKIEPLWPVVSAWLSYAYFLTGDTASALRESARAIELDSSLLPALNLGALMDLALGKGDAGRLLLAPALGNGMTAATYLYAKLGDTASANRLIHDMEARTPRPWFVDVARAGAMLGTGDSAGALSALERSTRDSGSMWVFFIPLGDPAFDLVRRSPRFAALLRQANVDLQVVSRPRRGA